MTLPESTSTRFSKYHVAGNDFVMIKTDCSHIDRRALAIRLCDRLKGIGSDLSCFVRIVFTISAAVRFLRRLRLVAASHERRPIFGARPLLGLGSLRSRRRTTVKVDIAPYINISYFLQMFDDVTIWYGIGEPTCFTH